VKHLPLVALLLTPLSGMTAEGAPAATGSKPNILFIAVDDMRPELGCYGNTIVKTPNIDRLAAQGMVFTKAYCQMAVCWATRSSLLTGRRPDATRVCENTPNNSHFRVALPDVVTLPQYFKNNGYYCASLNKIYHSGLEDGRSWSEPAWFPNGMTIDTDLVDWSKRNLKRVAPGVTEYVHGTLPWDNDKPYEGEGAKPPIGPPFEVSSKGDDELPDGYTAVEALKRLHELKAKKRPFFLAVGFIKPHLPFVAPKKYWDLYDPEKIPMPAMDHLPEGAPKFAYNNFGELRAYANVPKKGPIPADMAKTLRHGYYASISYTDAQVGRLLDALDQEGLADNTIIVFWGDHGYQLGDHGIWCKHTNFELATRAPLLISIPGKKTAGQKCDALVEFVDVYPTLVDLCGLPLPHELEGVSLKPALVDPKASVKQVAISQYPRAGGETGGRSLMGYSIRDERWRLTLWCDRNNAEIVATELYDEQNDPAETVNLATKPANQAVVKALSKYLPPPPTGSVKPPVGKPDKKESALKISIRSTTVNL